MPCGPSRAATPADAFAFSSSGPYARSVENAALLWTAPWRAWWALAAEAMAEDRGPKR